MTENFELLDTGQIEIMHDEVHARVGDASDCDMLRSQHDSLAAELVKRGIVHDTEIVCPESALGQAAPNYRRGFTDDICTNCAFGQLFPFCNLYKEDYTKGYTCDSFRYFELLILEPPHGFLMAQRKETAIANPERLEVDKGYLVVSDEEVYGIAILDQPAQIKTKDFDSDEWRKKHRITPRERRQFWPGEETFYVHPIKEWITYEDGIKLYQNGMVVSEPKLTEKQQSIVDTSKELPKQIVLIDEAVAITEDNKFFLANGISSTAVQNELKATFVSEPEFINDANESIPIYSLALVRNPKMRVSKKNLVAEASKRKKPKQRYRKQEGETMPFSKVTRDDEFCVINTETEEVEGCHPTEEEADAQLTALNINVDKGLGKPKRKKPKKDKGFVEKLKELYKNISDFIIIAETDVNSPELLSNDVGIAQKEVNGQIWHFTWSTNAFEDREGEIFSTKSLEDYVASNELSENKGYFNLWHINAEDGNFNTDFAKKEWQGVIGRFLVEAGPYLENERGQAAKQFFSEFPDGHPELAPEGWGCSPEYKYLPEERETGIYKNIWITRTSTLPRMAAANIWTESGQLTRSKMALTEEQLKAAITIFQGEDNVNALIALAESKTNELESAGIAHKAKNNEVPEEQGRVEPTEVAFNQEQFEALAEQISKQLSVDNQPLIEAIGNVSSNLQSMEDRIVELENKANAKQLAEVPSYTFSLQRASESEKTKVAEDDELVKQKPMEQKVDAKNITPSQFFSRPV